MAGGDGTAGGGRRSRVRTRRTGRSHEERRSGSRAPPGDGREGQRPAVVTGQQWERSSAVWLLPTRSRLFHRRETSRSAPGSAIRPTCWARGHLMGRAPTHGAASAARPTRAPAPVCSCGRSPRCLEMSSPVPASVRSPAAAPGRAVRVCETRRPAGARPRPRSSARDTSTGRCCAAMPASTGWCAGVISAASSSSASSTCGSPVQVRSPPTGGDGGIGNILVNWSCSYALYVALAPPSTLVYAVIRLVDRGPPDRCSDMK